MKIYYCISLLLISNLASFSFSNGDDDIFISGIIGPSNVVVGTSQWYEIDPDVALFAHNWTAGNFGIVDRDSISGGIYYTRVTWHTVGSATLRLYEDNGTSLVASKAVTISALSAPNTTITKTQNCGNTQVLRSTSPPAGAAYDWWWQTSSTGTSTSLGSNSTVQFSSNVTLYLRARTRVSPYSWSPAQNLGSISVQGTPPAVPDNPVNGHVISNSQVQVNISVGSVANATGYALYDAITGGTPLLTQQSTTFSPYVSQTKTFFVASMIQSCPSTTRLAVTAFVYSEPVISATNHGNIVLNVPVTLSTGDFTTYQWLDGNNNTIPGATNATYTTSTPGNYKVRVTKNTSAAFTTNFFNVGIGLEGQNMNYVSTKTMLVSGINATNMNSLTNDSTQMVTQYFDGLGRPVQTVSAQTSPDNFDVVQPLVYDQMGRQTVTYLPYASEKNGWYKTDFIAKEDVEYQSPESPQYWFYQNAAAKLSTDPMPYSVTIMEESPLNRPKFQGAPGQVWQPNLQDPTQNHSVKFAYISNLHGTASNQERIIAWKMNGVTGEPERRSVLANYIESGGYYSSNQLMIKSTEDENGNPVREYSNKAGQVILKKVYVKGIKTDFNTAGNWAETYYIYDDFGNLVVVLPPGAVK